MSATLLIMAAGLGSRYGGNKQVDGLGPNGEILMEYGIYDAIEAGFDKVVFVIRKSMDELFREKIGDKIAARVAVEYAYQEDDTLPQGFTPPASRTKPYGTVHAVYCAHKIINEPFAVINADDYYGKSAYRIMYDSLKTLPATGRASMVGYYLKNTLSKSGAVTRGICACRADGTLKKVTETYQIRACADGTVRDFAISEEGVLLDENALASMNFWGFTPWIFHELNEMLGAFVLTLKSDELKAEYPLPVMVDACMQKGTLAVDVLETDAIWFGVTYPEDKQTVSQALKALHGASMYPEKL